MARIRIQNARKTKFKSRYQFKNWTWTEAGERGNAVITNSSNKETADLISTCYYNPSTDTETAYCLSFDLDAHRAEEEWKDEEGRLDWGLIGNNLFMWHPVLKDKISAVIRSTGGKGLALVVPITPMELVDSTETCQNLARVVQKQFLNLLNHYGMGADKASLGIKRDFPNWMNETKLVDGDISILKNQQSERNRDAILTELNKYFNKISYCSDYVHKKGNETYLYPDQRAEMKFACLYMMLLDEYLYNGNHSVEKSIKELRLVTGLNEKTLSKVLNKGLHWLKAEYLGHKEGWRLVFEIDQDLTARAEHLTSKKEAGVVKKIELVKELKEPEKVEDGERNEWIAGLCLLLKHNGIDRSTALVILNRQIVRVSGYKYSRNCRNAARILHNIYNNKPHSFGCNEFGLGEGSWLGRELKQLSARGYKKSVQNYRRGVAPERYFSGDREVEVVGF